MAELCLKNHDSGKRVFYLQFHVDYWDYIGWKDPYGSKESTARQREFIKLSANKSTYTPQVAINGRESKGNDIANDIEKGLRTDAEVEINITASQSGKDKIAVKYELDGISEPGRLLVCLVERGLVSDCKAGENKGKVLKHENSVRVFEALDITKDGKGEVKLALPSNVVLANTSIIAYVLSAKDGIIKGAEYLNTLDGAPQGDPLPGIAVIEYYSPSGDLDTCASVEKSLLETCEKFVHEGKPVSLIAYHVDNVLIHEMYDPLGLKACTERLKLFSKALGIKNPTMPVIAVNGLLCEEPGNAEKHIADALDSYSQTSVELSIASKTDKKIKVAYSIERVNAPLTLTICLVQKKIERTLGNDPANTVKSQHVNVVRSLATATIRRNSKGMLEISVPPDIDMSCSYIFGYTSDTDWRVTGGMQLTIE